VRCFDEMGGRRQCEAGIIGSTGLPCQEPAVDWVEIEPYGKELWLCAECFDEWIEGYGGRTLEERYSDLSQPNSASAFLPALVLGLTKFGELLLSRMSHVSCGVSVMILNSRFSR
jgi:hypothetical protein